MFSHVRLDAAAGKGRHVVDFQFHGKSVNHG
jgi:hypothetical protein